jgi:hypothetical protein
VNLFISRDGGEPALRVRRMVLMGSALAALAGAPVVLAQAPASGSNAPAQAQPGPRPNPRCSSRPSMR